MYCASETNDTDDIESPADPFAEAEQAFQSNKKQQAKLAKAKADNPLKGAKKLRFGIA